MGLTIYCGRCGKSFSERSFDIHRCDAHDDRTAIDLIVTVILVLTLFLLVFQLFSRHP